MGVKLPMCLSLESDTAANWQKFVSHLKFLLLASSKSNSNDEVKVALLLNVTGDDNMKDYNNFNLAQTTGLSLMLF